MRGEIARLKMCNTHPLKAQIGFNIQLYMQIVPIHIEKMKNNARFLHKEGNPDSSSSVISL